MLKHWDDPLKELVNRAPQDFVKWLKPSSTFDKTLPTRLYREGFNVEIDTDLLCRVVHEDEPYLLQVRFQRENDPEADRHLLLYNVIATTDYDLATYSVIVYLKPEEFIPESPFIQPSLIPGQEDTLRFYYQTVKLWEIPTETILQAGIEGILPLVPFTREGSQRQSIDQTIEKLGLMSEQPKFELLSLTYQLASLVYTSPADVNWLRKRFAMIDNHNM